MKIVDVSKSSLGVQIIVHAYYPRIVHLQPPAVVDSTHYAWKLFQAESVRVMQQAGLSGLVLTRVDQRRTGGTTLEQQYSFAVPTNLGEAIVPAAACADSTVQL